MNPPDSRPPDAAWARSLPARMLRSAVQRAILVPLVSVLSPVRVVDRRRLKGIEHPVVFIANHQSHLDVPVALTALGAGIRKRLVIAAAADYFYRSRPVGWILSVALGTVPFVRRGGSSRPSLERLKSLLKQGWSVLIFPSGSRAEESGLKPGFAYLAVDTGTPVVPVFLYGLKDALPKGSFVPLPGGVAVAVGEAIPPGDDYEALVATAEQAFVTLRGIVHDHVAGWGEGSTSGQD